MGQDQVPGPTGEYRLNQAIGKRKLEKANANPVRGVRIIFGDHTWHGSTAKASDGLRLMVLGTYSRPHMQTQEAFRQTVTAGALARNPARFTRLVNVHNPMPWGKTPVELIAFCCSRFFAATSSAARVAVAAACS